MKRFLLAFVFLALAATLATPAQAAPSAADAAFLQSLAAGTAMPDLPDSVPAWQEKADCNRGTECIKANCLCQQNCGVVAELPCVSIRPEVWNLNGCVCA